MKFKMDGKLSLGSLSLSLSVFLPCLRVLSVSERARVYMCSFWTVYKSLMKKMGNHFQTMWRKFHVLERLPVKDSVSRDHIIHTLGKNHTATPFRPDMRFFIHLSSKQMSVICPSGHCPSDWPFVLCAAPSDYWRQYPQTFYTTVPDHNLVCKFQGQWKAKPGSIVLPNFLIDVDEI